MTKKRSIKRATTGGNSTEKTAAVRPSKKKKKKRLQETWSNQRGFKRWGQKFVTRTDKPKLNENASVKPGFRLGKRAWVEWSNRRGKAREKRSTGSKKKGKFTRKKKQEANGKQKRGKMGNGKRGSGGLSRRRYQIYEGRFLWEKKRMKDR